MKHLIQKYFIFILLLSPFLSKGQMLVEEPKKQQPTAFAIIVDKETYNQTKQALHQYRDAIELDGLSTYIVSGDFKNPDQVKAEIVKLHKRKLPLEGIVLIGEIPIVLVRNAQHMTTAFKMNEDEFGIGESSVPSDRFYDDLNLTFDFMKQDDKNPLHFYYKLRDDSPQKLNPAFYSARIRYPKVRGGDAHAAIAKFLVKAAASKKQNVLDHFVAFTGVAYNSECLTAWRDDNKAYREDFPSAFHSVNSAKQLNYRMADAMKFSIFEEYQRPEVDLFIMRKHGSPTKELINSSPMPGSFANRYDQFRLDLYTTVRRGQKRKQNVDSLIKVASKTYNLLPGFFDKLNDPEQIKKDSISDSNQSIFTADLRSLTTFPKVIILDACYNGSFHEDDYIAGNYIFNEGQTVVTQGNTRNVLQDRWTMDLVGILSHGVRMGHFNQFNATLEGHLIGDPTFRFTSKEYPSLSNEILKKKDDQKTWRNYLQSQDPILQSLALRMLVDTDSKRTMSKELYQIFSTSKFHTVRMQALKLLSRYNDEYFTDVVILAVNDPYEMVARQASMYAGKIGSTKLLPAIVDVMVNNQDRMRVAFQLQSAIRLFPVEETKAEFKRVIAQSNRVNKNKEIEDGNKAMDQYGNSLLKAILQIMDTKADAKKRINDIRSVRNYNYHFNIKDYLALLSNEQEDTSVRVAMAEALGWFKHSYVKNQIILAGEQLLKNNKLPQELRGEIIQTLSRLN